MKDLMGMMGKVREMQNRMQEVQAELSDMEIEGRAGAGLVQVVVNGKGDLRRIKIDPSLAKPDEIDILEDLVTAAFQDAKSKVEAAVQEKMASITGGLPLPPGLKLF